jgi:hypothetical protein
MEIVARHASPVTEPSAHAAGPAASIKSDTCPNSLLRPQLGMEAGVGIGLEEADFECKNSLILLVIQHFCETIFTDSFTMFC